MKNLTNEDLEQAFDRWFFNFQPGAEEVELVPFLQETIKPFKIKQQGWLRKARIGLFLSSNAVAERLGLGRTAYSSYEKSERTGAITLATLARAAEAMDCELVYGIRPKSKKLFSKIIWDKLLPISIKHPWLDHCDQKRKGAALAYIMSKNMMDPKVRRKLGWSQRSNT